MEVNTIVSNLPLGIQASAIFIPGTKVLPHFHITFILLCNHSFDRRYGFFLKIGIVAPSTKDEPSPVSLLLLVLGRIGSEVLKGWDHSIVVLPWESVFEHVVKVRI